MYLENYLEREVLTLSRLYFLQQDAIKPKIPFRLKRHTYRSPPHACVCA